MQVITPSGDGSKWSLIQLLLVLATLAAVLFVPNLTALVPNFNGHILPSTSHKVRPCNSSHAHQKCIRPKESSGVLRGRVEVHALQPVHSALGSLSHAPGALSSQYIRLVCKA